MLVEREGVNPSVSISGVAGLGEGLRNTQYSLGAPASHPDQHHRPPPI